MRKQKNILIIIIIFLSILLSNYQVFAESDLEEKIEFSEEYIEYLELEDKSDVIPPRTYDIPKDRIKVTNPLKLSRMLGSSTVTRYSLRDVIPENMIIKDQQNLGLCWTFASLATLESHLALQDYKKGITNPIIYDFSERHMDYATTREFLNNQINQFGLLVSPGNAGGTPERWVGYLTNGLGAISEEEMPYHTNTELIDISEIQNKNVITQVNDVVDFPSYSKADDKTEIIKQIKQHIMDYGGIYASIHFGQFDDSLNWETGAIYCDNDTSYPKNHGVAIIGWNDEYSVDNFNVGNQPENDGAWIIKDSHGTGVGDEGYIYVSYEDANIYKFLTGIENAQTELTYENIYQYNETGAPFEITFDVPKIYLANEFDKKTEGKEYLTQVAITSPEIYTCKVYVNPNGTSKEKKDLQQVQLKTGETETFGAGYHTIEFLNPIKIGDSFVVVLEIQGTREDEVSIMAEYNYGEFWTNRPDSIWWHAWDCVTIADEKCFKATEEGLEKNDWKATSKNYEKTEGKSPNYDTAIKAFTTSKVLECIEVETEPTKKTYIENQNFDTTGMVVKEKWANGDSIEITDYTIVDGKNLSLGQTSVTISYKGFTVTQPIEVVKNTVESIRITNEPKTTQYYSGDNFDATDMIVEAIYKDGTTKVITDYTIENGIDLKYGQTSVTISYKDCTVTQPIVVVKNTVESIVIITPPKTTQYYSEDNFDATGMVVKGNWTNGDLREITDYTIENGVDLKEGQTSVTISYKECTVLQPIVVVKNTVEGIRITTAPKTIQYYVEGDFDATGMIVEAIYKNDKTKVITDYTIENGTDFKYGQTSVTISYNGFKVTQTIEVLENTVESIRIITAPKKTEYYEGDNFNPTGMIVELIYKNGKRENSTGYTIKDGVNLKKGQSTVTISYEGKTTMQEIIVKADKVVKLEVVSNATKLNYVAGQDFDAQGLIIKAIYESGKENKISASDYIIKDGTDLKENQTTVTIEFEGQTVTQSITVVAKTVTSISVKNMPMKTEYLQSREDLDLKGGTIKISYNDGTEEEIPMTSKEIMANGFNNKEPGTETITLTYKGKTTQFNINVKELEKPTNSNLDNIQGNVKRVRAYYFTDKTKKEYVVLNVKISDIVEATGNEKMEYYYYLSQNPKEENIIDWIKIEQLDFEINTLGISNYDELAKADKIYLYVKEVATRNDMKSEKIANALPLDIENMNIEEYIDGEKKADVNSDEITNSTPGEEPDDTLAPEKIPYAGKNILILFLVLAIIVLGRLTYLKYKDIEIK